MATYAEDHYIDPETLGIPDYELEPNNKILLYLTNFAIHSPHIRKGDTISLLKKEEKYLNNFTYIYDGKKVINLDIDLDSDGHLPNIFKVSDFEYTPDYWKYVINSNSIFWLDDQILDKMVFIVQEKEKKYIYSNIIINGKNWRCYIDYINDQFEETKSFKFSEWFEHDRVYFELESTYYNEEECKKECIKKCDGNIFFLYEYS